MRDLTLSQEYLLCAVNEKGRLPHLGVERTVCLVAAALTDSWVPALGVGLPAFLVPLLISRSAAGQLVTRIAVACAAMIFAAVASWS